MDAEKRQELFDDKYQPKLGLSYEEWMEAAPNTEEEAYAYCQQIDDELRSTYEEWFSAQGEQRDEMESYRARLKLEYDIVEELFGLELQDK